MSLAKSAAAKDFDLERFGLKTKGVNKELMFQKNDPHYPRKRKRKTSRNAKKTRNITRKG